MICTAVITRLYVDRWTRTSFQTVFWSPPPPPGGLCLSQLLSAVCYLIMEMLSWHWEMLLFGRQSRLITCASRARINAETRAVQTRRWNFLLPSAMLNVRLIKSHKCDDLRSELSHLAQTDERNVWRESHDTRAGGRSRSSSFWNMPCEVTSCWLVCRHPSWNQIQMGRAESRRLSLVGWSRCLPWAVRAGWQSLAGLRWGNKTNNKERDQGKTIMRQEITAAVSLR